MVEFFRSVVDSEDLLNISREAPQQNHILRMIKKTSAKICLDRLAETADERRIQEIQRRVRCVLEAV